MGFIRTKGLRLLAAAVMLTVLPLLGGPAAADTATFANPAAIQIPSPGPPPGCPSFPAPNNSCPPTPAIVNGTDVSSTIAVTGMTGNLTDVNITLNDLTYTNYDASDLDIMLMAPNGSKVMLMSDLCGDGGDPAEYPITSPIDLTFDDSATGPLPIDDGTQCVTGTYKPLDEDDDPGTPAEEEYDFDFTSVDVFCGPYDATYPPGRCNPAAPVAPTSTLPLSTFNGLAPNGTWTLYVVDDLPGDVGSFLSGQIAGGWSIELTTGTGGTTTTTAPTTTTTTTIPPPSAPITIYVTDVALLEGDSGTTSAVFTVWLSEASNQTVTVKHATANTTATAGNDYVAKPLTTLTYAPGETSKLVSVTVNGDTLKEGNETFKLNLSAPTNATIADTSGTATIIDEEGPIWAHVNDVTVVEGNAGTTTANFTITLSATPAAGQTISLKYATANGTATTAGGDYVAVPLTAVTFAAGETSKTVPVTVNGDTTVEPNETFNLNLSAPTGGLVIADTGGKATIQNDDGTPGAVPPRTITVTNTAVLEGDSRSATAVFTLSLSSAHTSNVTVKYITANTTATAGSDYVAVPSTTVTFTPGQVSKTVPVAVTGDTLKEGNETFKLNLSAPTNAALADSSGTATIIDEEGPIFAYVANVTAAEGNGGTTNLTVPIKLSFPVSAGQSVSLKYVTANGTAVAPTDYTAVPLTTMTFAAGEVEKTVTVTVNGDTTVEPNETFNLNLSAPVGLVLADTAGSQTIKNDD